MEQLKTPTHTSMTPLALESKQQQYFSSIKLSQPQLLNEFEIYALNDKLEVSSDEEEKEKKNLQQILMPFDKNIAKQKLSRKSQHFKIKKKKVGIVQIIKSQMNEMQSKIQNFVEKRKSNKQSQKKVNQTVLSPDGYIKLSWDLLCMVLIFYEILTIPLKISFEIEINETWDTIVDLIFITDIILTFNTAFYKNGKQIYSRKEIAINYFKLWFWIDVAASFPHEEVISYFLEESSDQNSIAQSAQLLRLLKFIRFIKAIRLLRLAKLKVIFDKIEEFLQLSTTIAAILSFFQLSVFVLFWSHWLGCIFHFVATNEDHDDNWLYIYGLDKEDWKVRYINSIYWAVTTMNTVGYGDISPQTPTERLIGIFFLLVATYVFSYTMNTIGSALQAIEDKKSIQKKKLTNIKNYMKKVKLDQQLQNRIRKYLQYVWETDHSFNLYLITSKLSESLKYEFTIQINGTIVANCAVLCEQFSIPFLKDLTQIFIEQIIIPDEFIFIEEETVYVDKNLYFIQEGDVDIMMQKTSQIMSRLSKNDYFGEVAFFSDSQRWASAKSIQFTSLLLIQRGEFLELLKRYPSDRERFCEIKDKINFGNDYSDLGLACFACQKDDHLVKNCPNVHFKIDLRLLNQAKQQCMQSLHRKFKRKEKVCYNFRADLEIIQLAAKKMQQMDFSEECNIDEKQIEQSMRMIKIPKPKKIKTRFRQERAQLRRLQRLIEIQEDRIAKLSFEEQQTQKQFNQLQKMMDGTYDGKDSRIISSSSECETDDDNESEIEEKMKQLLNDYQEEKTRRKNIQQDYQVIDIDQVACFENYQKRNNIDQVLGEQQQIIEMEGQQRVDMETQLDEEVLAYIMDKYKIDIGWSELQEHIKQQDEQNQTSKQNYTSEVISRLTRQEKKHMNLLKQTKNSFQRKSFKFSQSMVSRQFQQGNIGLNNQRQRNLSVFNQ